jgi:hypothetical protein
MVMRAVVAQSERSESRVVGVAAVVVRARVAARQQSIVRSILREDRARTTRRGNAYSTLREEMPIFHGIREWVWSYVTRVCLSTTSTVVPWYLTKDLYVNV